MVPADDKLNARLIISRAVINALEDLKMSYPMPDKQHLKELQSMRKLLAK